MDIDTKINKLRQLRVGDVICSHKMPGLNWAQITHVDSDCDNWVEIAGTHRIHKSFITEVYRLIYED